MERKPIRIQQGNDCLLKMLPKMVDGTPVPAYLLSDIEIKLNATTVEDWAIEGDYITIPLPDNQPLGTYDITLTAKIGDRDVRDCRTALFCRVPNGEGIPYEEYCSEFTIITVTDAELEALKAAAMQAKANYEAAHAEAVAARDAYIRKAESLDGVAKETTSQTILSKLDAIHIDLTPVLQAITLAKETILSSVDAAKSFLVIKLNDAVTTLGGWFTSGKQEILAKIENTQPDLSAVAKEATLNEQSQAIKNKIDAIDIDTSTLATLENQQKMMVNFGMADEMPDMQALTDTEIINTYDGYDSEGQHIEGIADQTYGHLVPAQVTIDDEPFTFYQERTYADYGYSVLYKNGVAIDTTTTHPQEDDELTTTI